RVCTVHTHSFPTRRSSDLLIQEGISAEDIATQGNVNLDAVEKLKESNIKSESIVELLKEIKRPEEIGEKCQCSQTHVYNVREKKDRKSTRLNSSHVSISYA